MKENQKLLLAIVITAIIVGAGTYAAMAFIGGKKAKEKKPTLELWYTPSHYGQSEAEFASVLKSQLEATGKVDISLKSAEWATYAGEYLAKGVMPSLLLGWYPDYVDPNNYLNPFLYSANSPYLGGFYNDTGMDYLLDQAKIAGTKAKRAALYKKAQMKMAKEAAIIPVYQGKLITASRGINKDSIHLGTSMRLRYDYINGTDSITMDTTDSITHLDPAKAYDFFTWETFNNFNEGLLGYKPGTTTLKSGLAVNWTETGETEYTNPDTGRNESCETTWTYYLRPGLKFHYYDGGVKTRNWVFNASTEKYSIMRVARLAADPSFLVTGTVKNVTTWDDPDYAEDEYPNTPFVVKFHLKRDVGYFPALSASVPYQPVDPAVWPKDEIVSAPDTPSGLGPYVVKDWGPKEYVHYKENPDYYAAERPYADTFNVEIQAKPSTMASRIKAGETNLVWKTLTPTQVEDLKGKSGIQVKETPGPYIRYVVMRCNKKPWDSVLARKAFAAAINRSEICHKVYKDTTTPLYSMVPKGMWSHIPAFKRVYGKRNMKLSKNLFERAF